MQKAYAFLVPAEQNVRGREKEKEREQMCLEKGNNLRRKAKSVRSKSTRKGKKKKNESKLA